MLSQNAEERFFEMMNIYTDACCKVDSFNILTCIYDRFLFSQELKSSLEKTMVSLEKILIEGCIGSLIKLYLKVVSNMS